MREPPVGSRVRRDDGCLREALRQSNGLWHDNLAWKIGVSPMEGVNLDYKAQFTSTLQNRVALFKRPCFCIL